MMIEIHHVTLLTQNLARARQFYENILGLRVNAERPKMDFDGVWYHIGANQQLHLMALPDPEAGVVRPSHGGRDRHVALSVRDLSWLVGQLDNAGISYTRSRSGRAALFCRDPDQNALEFVELS